MNNNFKIIIYFSLVLSFIYSENLYSERGIYEDVFTQDIYDVTDYAKRRYLSALAGNDESGSPLLSDKKNYKDLAEDVSREVSKKTGDESQREILGTLYFQKICCVYTKITEYLRRHKQFLSDSLIEIECAFNSKTNTNLVHSLLDSVGKYATLVITTALSINPYLGGLKFITSLFGSLVGKSGDDNINKQGYLNDMRKTISEIENEIKKIEIGIFSESIKELEENYVLRKVALPKFNDDLAHTIESTLINARKLNYPFAWLKLSLENALRLPSAPKVVDKLEALRRFKESKFFENYPTTTRQNLENVIISIAEGSSAPDTTSVPLRRTYFFYGDPGIGKSCAAEEIGKILGLPTEKWKIKSISELSSSNLEGTDPLSKETNYGWIVKPLLKGDSNKSTCTNGILILDDFDRVLLDPKSGVTGLAFFLDYLDPNKKSFYSQYFKAEIDISRIHIIVTGNLPIPKTKEYAALRERFMDIIQFEGMDISVRKKILEEYFSKLREYYHIPLEIEDNKFVSMASEIAENPQSVRSLKKSLQNVVTDFSAGGWERVELRKNRILQEKESEEKESKKKQPEETSPHKNSLVSLINSSVVTLNFTQLFMITVILFYSWFSA